MDGRERETWDRLTETGERFLLECARTRRMTSYVELNSVLAGVTGEPPFDFARPEGRAAMGRLLYGIVLRTFPGTGVMLSALVRYLGSNDAGSAFYTSAKELGALRPNATADDKLMFWMEQLSRTFACYAPAVESAS